MCSNRNGGNYDSDGPHRPLGPRGTAWLDEMAQRRATSLEMMLREKLAVPEGEDLLQAALAEQFLRNKFNMHDLIVE